MPVKDQIRAHCRFFIERDMPAVLAIEAASFAHPWGEDDFLWHLRDKATHGLVAEVGPAWNPAGYTVFQAEADHLNLLNLAVHPDQRHQGVGSQMVHRVVTRLGEKRKLIVANVDERNLIACQFFGANGFKARSVLRDWYGGNRDAYRFEFRL